MLKNEAKNNFEDDDDQTKVPHIYIYFLCDIVLPCPAGLR